MANIYKLDYTADEINEKLGKIDGIVQANENFANILKGTVTDGGYAFVEGVNPLANSIKVSVAKDYNYDYYGIPDDAEVTLKIYDKKSLLQISTDYLEPTVIDGVTITNNGDGSFTLNGTVTCVHDEEEGEEGEEWEEEEEEEELGDTHISLFTSLESSPLIVGGTITFSSGNWWIDKGNDQAVMCVSVKNAPFGDIVDSYRPTATASPDYPISDIYLWAEEGTIFRNEIIRPQLEIGEVSTEYELPEEPRSITTSWRALREGVELQAITSNSLIVLTEVEGYRYYLSSISLVAEYNQDTNVVIGKLFEEIERLKTTIVELGGAN